MNIATKSARPPAVFAGDAGQPGVSAAVGERRAIAADDPVQDIPGLLEAALLYAGELGLLHPYIGPLNGDLSGLPQGGEAVDRSQGA